MKLKLIDACDKMGPRVRHILQFFVRDQDLSSDEPPSGAKTYLKISNSQDYKPIFRRMKCLFTELLSDDDIFKKDGFKALMPSHTLYVPECNSLLFSYSDYRIESLVLSIMNDSMQVQRVFDKRTVSDSEWVGIILRNIPMAQGREIQQIKSIFNESLQKLEGSTLLLESDISQPILIQSKLCTVIQIRGGIEQAEYLCRAWNQKKAREELVKCHVHPYSKFKRKNSEKHPYFKVNKRQKL